MKYIMLLKGQQRYPILFPEDLVHIEVAERLTGDHGVVTLQGATVVSAGTVLIGAVSTDGKSTSLGVRALAQDTTFINVWDYSRGYDNPTDAAHEQLVRAKVCHDLLVQLGKAAIAKSLLAQVANQLGIDKL